MKKARALVAVAAATALWPASPAGAHPLGNFTVNRFSGIEVAPNEVTIHYVLDLAEVPSFQEFTKLDTDRDNVATDVELDEHAARKALFVRDGLRLSIDGNPVEPAIERSGAWLDRGQGGLPVLRFEFDFAAPLMNTEPRIEYRDRNFGSLPGWKEVVAYGSSFSSSNVPATSISNGLRTYPVKLLSRPPDVRSAGLVVAPGGAAAGSAARPGSSAGAVKADRFLELVESNASPLSTAVALLLAFGFGALHALGPGHGKSVLAAYVGGTGGRVRQVAGVAGAVSLMHTVSVLVLGAATLALSSMFSPAAVYPWLALVSGVVVAVIGTVLFVTRWRSRTRGSGSHPHDHSPPAGKGLVAIVAAGGLVPSPAAVVVLLASIAVGRVAFGLALVLAFSAGLAVSLGIIGAVVMRARVLASRRWQIGTASVLPALSSAVIAAAGTLLAVRAALELTA